MIISAILCSLLGCTAQQQKFESLDTEAFEQAISDTSVVRLDVRSIDEYSSGHITNAVNIDVTKEVIELNTGITGWIDAGKETVR